MDTYLLTTGEGVQDRHSDPIHSALVSLFARVRSLFSGPRLILRLLLWLVMSLALLVFHIKQSPTEHVTTAGMAVGVALGGLFGLAYNRYLRRGIRQNEYIRPPRTDLLKQGIILIPTMLIFWHFLPQLVDDSKVWNRFFVFPFFLLLPVGMLYNVLWLNEYERKVGPVVIRKHRR